MPRPVYGEMIRYELSGSTSRIRVDDKMWVTIYYKLHSKLYYTSKLVIGEEKEWKLALSGDEIWFVVDIPSQNIYNMKLSTDLKLGEKCEVRVIRNIYLYAVVTAKAVIWRNNYVEINDSDLVFTEDGIRSFNITTSPYAKTGYKAKVSIRIIVHVVIGLRKAYGITNYVFKVHAGDYRTDPEITAAAEIAEPKINVEELAMIAVSVFIGLAISVFLLKRLDVF